MDNASKHAEKSFFQLALGNCFVSNRTFWNAVKPF